MGQITDPALLAQLEGGAAPEAAPTAAPAQTAAPAAQPAPTSGGQVQDAALLSQLNDGSEEASTGEPEAPLQPQQKAGFPAFKDQGELNHFLSGMLTDKNVPTKRIRDFYSSLGAQISEHDDAALRSRDKYLGIHGEAMPIGVDPDHVADRPTLVDNRPQSYGQGIANGAMDVVGNVFGGLGWAGNQVGLTNHFGQDVRQGINDYQATLENSGNPIGEAVGKGIAVAPTMLATGGLTGAARVAGLGLEGIAQGALTTNADTPEGVALDAATGGITNMALGSAGDYAGSRFATGIKPTEAAANGREVLDAAGRLSRDGVTVAPTPEMTGGMISKGLGAVSEAGIVSNAVSDGARKGVHAGLEEARDRAARSLLPQGETTVRGINDVSQDVLNNKGGLGKFAEDSQATADSMYDQAKALAGNVEFDTPKTLAKLDEIITRMKNRAGDTPGLASLERLRDDLAPSASTTTKPNILQRLILRQKPVTTPGSPSEFSIESLRDLRTGFGDNFDINQRNVAQAAKQLWGPLSDDIQAGLKSKGKFEAAKAYADADSFWNTSRDQLENIVKPIVGDRSAEQLGSHLVQLSRKQSQELDDALAVMSPDMAARVRAAIVGDLGKAKPGAQNVGNTAFSPSEFNRDWSGLVDANSPTFTGGAVGQDLQDVARVGQGMREGGSLRNSSGTARAAEAFHQFGRISSGVAGLSTFGKSLAIEAGVGALAGSNKLAKLGVRLGEARPVTKTTLRSLQGVSKTRSGWNALGGQLNGGDEDEF